MLKNHSFPIEPIYLNPQPVERVWGGKAVARAFGWAPPVGKTIGEWWTLSFRQDCPSVIGDGPFAGIPLPQLTTAHPELLGESIVPALLIKILDSAEKLSVQVHPDDRLAAELGLDSGKTECWYFLESDPEAFIFHGIQEGVEIEAFFRQASQNPPPEEMAQCLNRVAVREGEIAFIPAGSVHAIGEGVLLMEVQQNSDTTFRIYDWGRPREVHLERARQAIDRATPEAGAGVFGETGKRRVRCEKFLMEEINLQGEGELPPRSAIYSGLTCLNGEGKIRCKSYERSYEKGDSFFLPARCPALAISSSCGSTWILSTQLESPVP